MQDLINGYHISKVEGIIVGGSDRQGSIAKGLEEIKRLGGNNEDIVTIHDGVRPLVSQSIIEENIRITRQYGCAVTAHPVCESVVITDDEQAGFEDIKKRSATYSMTSPQTFMLGEITETYKHLDKQDNSEMPLLDAAMVYVQSGKKIHLVKEQNTNIKITTPEDYYILRAMLELEENKFIFGL